MNSRGNTSICRGGSRPFPGATGCDIMERIVSPPLSPSRKSVDTLYLRLLLEYFSCLIFSGCCSESVRRNHFTMPWFPGSCCEDLWHLRWPRNYWQTSIGLPWAEYFGLSYDFPILFPFFLNELLCLIPVSPLLHWELCPLVLFYYWFLEDFNTHT